MSRRHGDALFLQQLFDNATDFHAHAVAWERVDLIEVEHADELAVDLALELEGAAGSAQGARGRLGGWPVTARGGSWRL